MRTYINPAHVIEMEIQSPLKIDEHEIGIHLDHGWQVEITMTDGRTVFANFENENQCRDFIRDNFKLVKVN